LTLLARGAPALLLLLAAGGARADEAFSEYAQRDGVIYQQREVAGSRFREYHAVTLVRQAPEEVLAGIWSGVTDAIPKTVKRREVLSRSDDQIVVYDQIRAPVVSDRDVVIRIRKVTLDHGVRQVRFDSTLELGPPPAPKHVRLAAVRGAWPLTPAPGGTQLEYTCYSEPGGSIPAWIARGAQRDQIALDMERILARLKR